MRYIDLSDEEIIQAYIECGSSTKAAKKLEISQWSVIQRVNKHDIPHAPRTEYNRDEILQLWNKSRNIRTIENKIGIPHGYLLKVLKKLGIKVPFEGPGKYALPMDELAKRYEAGETCGDIARSLGLSPERIRRRLRAYGVEIRSAAESVPCGEKNRFYRKEKKERETMHYYRRQSYEVAAICLGQPLPKDCIIHHIDNDPENNHPENLLVFYSKSGHARYHAQLTKLLRQETEVDTTQLALESGAVELPPPPAPIVLESDTERLDPSSTPWKPVIPQPKLIL